MYFKNSFNLIKLIKVIKKVKLIRCSKKEFIMSFDC